MYFDHSVDNIYFANLKLKDNIEALNKIEKDRHNNPKDFEKELYKGKKKKDEQFSLNELNDSKKSILTPTSDFDYLTYLQYDLKLKSLAFKYNILNIKK